MKITKEMMEDVYVKSSNINKNNIEMFSSTGVSIFIWVIKFVIVLSLIPLITDIFYYMDSIVYTIIFGIIILVIYRIKYKSNFIFNYIEYHETNVITINNKFNVLRFKLQNLKCRKKYNIVRIFCNIYLICFAVPITIILTFILIIKKYFIKYKD